jgi:hypothetical protein
MSASSSQKQSINFLLMRQAVIYRLSKQCSELKSTSGQPMVPKAMPLHSHVCVARRSRPCIPRNAGAPIHEFVHYDIDICRLVEESLK